MAERILVVDDEPDLLELVRVNLAENGFQVEATTSGREVLDRVRRSPPDLLVLDLMMPDVAGTEICRQIRATPELADLPIIMLTAKAEELDRVVGFELGADDYVPKPFSARELVLRVRALLRRTEAPEERSSDRLRLGPLEIDVPGYRVAVDGQPVPLTALEFRLLLDLARHPGRVQSRDQLLERVWRDADSPEPRTVDNLVKRLREKLGAARSWIETIRGVGYRLREPA